MLTNLHIENYALIRETDIGFGSGFVVITGETGAGKSILLGALGLLLGQRADTAVLADKERKCIVEAQFDIAGLGLQPLFEEADVDYDDRLILRREILPSAKSRAFANDTPVQLPFLRRLGSHLVDIHSQHQTLTLADSQFRLSLLDTLSAPVGKASALPPYADAYRRYQELKRKLEELTSAEAQSRREQDYLQFQFDELSAARLEAGEQEALEQEQQLLSHAEAVREGLANAAAALDDDSEQSVLARLRQAKNSLSHVTAYYPEADALLGRLDSAFIELDDINGELQRSADSISYNPERQQQVDERLALLYRLEQKHGVDTVDALIAIRDSLDERLQGIASLDDRIHDLMEQVDGAFAVLQQAADALTAERTRAGKLMAKQIVPLLRELGMPEARFTIELAPTPTYGPSGHDSAAFLFNANRGGELRDLAKVASGGELSRLMLAVKSMLTSRTLLPTVIFDEIDSGVSGDIAGAVARIMCRMAEKLQVVAITHLPQIAARASQHLKVYKENETDRTVSRIRQLSPPDRVNEVAVMLSSDPPTPAALQTAKELMQ
ncbi:MAG: DNA repair protein RecN [Bacteroidales bacterium]|nr:DNA repair protein RecN [Bacteroidales bacterium]